jgi:hypothetical protein
MARLENTMNCRNAIYFRIRMFAIATFIAMSAVTLMHVPRASAQEPPPVDEMVTEDVVTEEVAAEEVAESVADQPVTAPAPTASSVEVAHEAALPPPFLPADAPPPPAPPIVDNRPYGRGDMELSIGLGFGGYSDSFTLAIGADFACYVVARLAPGLALSYRATWGDVAYPQSFTVFPYLKYVLVRSFRFAPYILVGGGRDFEWGGAEESFTGTTFNGYVAVDSWLFGVGGGAVVMFSPKVGMKFQVLAMYENYDEAVFDPDAGEVIDHQWYPAISLGIVFSF